MSLHLIPQPRSLTRHPGSFTVPADVVIVAAGGARAAGWLLHDTLRSGAGISAPVVGSEPSDGHAMTLSVADRRQPSFPSADAERYRLDVRAAGIRVQAPNPAGLVRAVQTLRQLMPADMLRAAPVLDAPVELPCLTIEDAPRFGWRGVMLDVARHFQPKDFLLRLIDLAALHQVNVVHLHLTDDQGWRLEVPGWPRLTEIASWRPETVVGHARAGHGFDGTPHGGYYTAADLKEVVAYAAARYITVVPEIDMPGHVRAALAAYPELGNTGAENPVATSFGVFPEVLAPTDAALRFARDVLDTIVDIFDSPFIHIGGDECPRTEWHQSAAARARADELGLDGVERLQSWLTGVLAEHLRGHGRRVVGWDEILDDGGAPHDAVVSVWRELSTAEKAIAAGHDVVVAPHKALYLDSYPSDQPAEPLHIHGNLPLETIAEFDPAPNTDDAHDDNHDHDEDHDHDHDQQGSRGRVLGVQAQLWTEYLPTPRDVEYAAFPRLAAVADMAWADVTTRRAHPVTDRLPGHLERLDALGVNYRPLAGPRPWQRGGTGARARYDG